MKKKTLSFLLSILLCPSLVSCSPSVSDNLQTETQEESRDVGTSDEPLYNHISNDDYLNMLNEYNDIFMDAMSIVSTNQVSTLISNDATITEVVAEIDRVLSEIEISSAELQAYYDTFYQTRSEAPMQTKIMTMLSCAQSSLTQYKIAMENLKQYSLSPNQEYMDGFSKYTQKSQESIEEYNSVLNEELFKLGER